MNQKNTTAKDPQAQPASKRPGIRLVFADAAAGAVEFDAENGWLNCSTAKTS
jgi:hypothetical protein